MEEVQNKEFRLIFNLSFSYVCKDIYNNYVYTHTYIYI